MKLINWVSILLKRQIAVFKIILFVSQRSFGGDLFSVHWFGFTVKFFVEKIQIFEMNLWLTNYDFKVLSSVAFSFFTLEYFFSILHILFLLKFVLFFCLAIFSTLLPQLGLIPLYFLLLEKWGINYFFSRCFDLNTTKPKRVASRCLAIN